MQVQSPDRSRPKISVLLPFRDAARTLDECLESIQAQTFNRFELLAVDDHSVDESTEILRARHDPHCRLLPNPGRGLVDALNTGLRAARAPLIARMDADDIMHPERLALQHRHFADQPELDLSASQVELFPPALIGNGYREYLRWQNELLTNAELSDNRYVESPFAHPSVMFRRDAVAELGGYRQGDFPEDYDLWLRMFRAGCRMEKLPRVLLRWRESPQRLSRRDRAYRRAAFDQLRAEYLSRDPRLTSERELAYWGAGARPAGGPDYWSNGGTSPPSGGYRPEKKSATGLPACRWFRPHGWRGNRGPWCWSMSPTMAPAIASPWNWKAWATAGASTISPWVN